VKWKFTFWIKQNRSSLTFQQIFNFYIPFISSSELKKVHLFLIFSWKQKYLVAYIGEENKIIKLQTLAWKVMLQNERNSRLNSTTVIVSYFWAKYKHETHTLLRLCLIKFLSAHTLQRGKGLVDYQGREQQGWGPMWLMHQSRKLHSALSEIVSLVSSVTLLTGNP